MQSLVTVNVNLPLFLYSLSVQKQMTI